MFGIPGRYTTNGGENPAVGVGNHIRPGTLSTGVQISYRYAQGRIKTKFGLMLQPRKGPIFLSIGVL